jgi:hypothetical protein
MAFSENCIVHFQPFSLMNSAENFQIREQLVEDKRTENLQPSYMCKKSEFEDHFMAVSCMRFADFCCRFFQPSLSSFFLIISLRILLENVFLML